MSTTSTPRFVGISGIASILNVGESRVRQLVTSPDFPKPFIALSARNRVWYGEAIAEWGRNAQDATRVVAADLPRVTEALPRIIDELVTATLNFHPWSLNVYVRAFRGDDYSIVLVSPPEGTYGFQTHREEILSSVLQQFRSKLGSRVCWIEDLRPAAPGEVANPVMTVLPDNTVTDMTWLRISYEELTERLGAPVEMYPAERMTENLIRLYKAAGDSIKYITNEEPIRKLLETVRILETSSLPAENREHALDFTAHALLSLDRLARTENGEPSEPFRYAREVKWAVRDYRRTLRPEERSIADRYAILDGPAWDELDELNDVTARLLIAWQESVDEYSENPDPRIEGSLRGLIGTITLHIRDRRVRELVEAEQRYPYAMRAILFPRQSEHVRRYLEGAVPVPAPPQGWRREHRLLSSRLGPDVDFHRDRFGNLFGVSRTTDILGVFWPRESNEPTASSVLLDGTLDTIAYLADANGQPMDLLPRIKRPGSVGWASGYSGTGAGDLISAILDYVDARGIPADTEHIRRVIGDHQIGETTLIAL